MFARKIEDRLLTFGVSGLLYQSNVLMYDHQTESLWSQVLQEAVAGPMTGTALKTMKSTLTSWKKWRRRFPETLVLSKETGFDRNYSRDPYEKYYQSKRGLFGFLRPGPADDDKRMVAGVKLNGETKAYPLDLLREKTTVRDRLNNTRLLLRYNAGTDELTITGGQGEEIGYIISYWFVWRNIHPETELFSAADPQSGE